MEATGKPSKRASDAGPPLRRPPKPLGSGESPLYPAQRNAVIGASVIVTLYAAACLWLGWGRPAGTGELVLIDGFAGLFSMLFLATVWLGVSEKTPTGFQVGRATYLAPRKAKVPTGVAARVAPIVAKWIPWQLREPLFRLPVLLPIVWAAATFASVNHQVHGDIHGQLEPTLIALLTVVIAINGFLAVRGRRTIDFLGALATVLVLIAGTVISLVQIAGGGQGQVHWVAAALVFGLVAILQTAILGADSPDAEKASGEVHATKVSDASKTPEPPPEQPPTGRKTRTDKGTEPRSYELQLLVAAGALVALVLLVSALWLVPLAIRGAVLGAGGLHSVALLFLLGSAACLVTWNVVPPERRDPWLRRGLILGAASALFGIGGSFFQKHVEGSGADCLAFDAQFGQLVGDQTQAIALRLSKDDQRRHACLSAVNKLEWPAAQPDCLAFDAEFAQLVRTESLTSAVRAMEADGRRAACKATLGRIREGQQISDCVAYLAQLDELADDEPIEVAAVAIEHDPRTRACHPQLGLLARR